MSELNELIKSIAGLPHLAIWAIAIFYGYKVAVVGSIYGVIRFIATKWADVLEKRADVLKVQAEREHVVKVAQMNETFVNQAASEAMDALLREVRMAEHKHGRSDYVHRYMIDELLDAYRAKRDGGAA